LTSALVTELTSWGYSLDTSAGTAVDCWSTLDGYMPSPTMGAVQCEDASCECTEDGHSLYVRGTADAALAVCVDCYALNAIPDTDAGYGCTACQDAATVVDGLCTCADDYTEISGECLPTTNYTDAKADSYTTATFRFIGYDTDPSDTSYVQQQTYYHTK
ncbi:hypothetical protein KIPB_010937, partial [Kipferlia bialata]